MLERHFQIRKGLLRDEGLGFRMYGLSRSDGMSSLFSDFGSGFRLQSLWFGVWGLMV